ncbi:hypothetical protein CRG98_013249 [Punica granatum]|uniref:Uncharacterized protein n=1 Tax=Punica granatum TaxID=22663 RepID=A0A2I0KCT4_PUNGR|nr:hypothetical protein CRG98_013249 [Punica granatum]
MQICWGCSPVHTLFYASQVRQACSLVLLANLSGLLARAHSLLRFASSPSLLARTSCKSVGPARPAHSHLGFADSLSFLASASCTSVGPSRSCTLSFTLFKFAKPARPCTLSFTLCKLAEPASSYFLQICPAFSPEHTLFYASSPSLLASASYESVGPARPCTHSFTLRKFAEPAGPCTLYFKLRKLAELVRPCILQIYRAAPSCPLFYASQVRRACSLVLSGNLPGLLARAQSLLRFVSPPSLLVCASYKSVGPARPCTHTFTLRKFAEPARSGFLQIYRAFLPVPTLFHASQIRRACSLVLFENRSNLLAHAHSLLSLAMLLAHLSGLLDRAHSLLHFAIPPSLLARASCKSVEPARPCTLSFKLRKFAEPSRSRFLKICRECSPVRNLFYASQVRRACSLSHLTNLSGLLARAHSLLRFASSPSLLARSSCKSARLARQCTLYFKLRKLAEPVRSCILQICRAAPSCPLFSPGLLARAFWKSARPARPCTISFMLRKSAEPARSCFCKSAGPARPCTLSFTLFKFVEPARSCFMQICRDCSTVQTLFYASEVRRAFSFVLPAHLSGLLDRAHSLFTLRNFAELALTFVSSPSQLARAFCKSAGPARPCTVSFTLFKFVDPARSCFLQICRDCSPVHTLFYASQGCRAFSFVLLAHLSGLLDRAHSLLLFAISPSLLARASCKSVEPALRCTLSFKLRKLDKPVRSCILQICRAAPPCTLLYASQVSRACSLGLSANLPGLLAHVHSLLRFSSSLSLLARTSCKSAGTARPCRHSFMLRKFAEPSHFVLLAHLLGLLDHAHSLFTLRKFAEPSHFVLLAHLSGLLDRAHSMEQLENGDTQLHYEYPNGAKPTLEASSPPNIRSHDIWRKIDISNPHETTTGMILTQLGVQCHRPCIKRPPGASRRVVSSSGTYRSARVESRYKPPITMIFTQLEVQCHRSCTKGPPGTSCRPVSSSGASRVCFVPTGTSTHALLPKPPQARPLVSWESNETGPVQKFHPDQPVQPRQARLPVGSASRPDCTGSGLFVPAESPDSLCHFSDSFLVFRG